MRGIQYAAACRFIRAVSGILDRRPQCAIAHNAGDDSLRGRLLPCHLRSPYTISVQLLVVMHVDRHLEQLPGEFEWRFIVRDRTGTVPADVEAGPRDEIVEGELGLHRACGLTVDQERI